MERKLQLLDSQPMTGSDGQAYKVRIFEVLVCDERLLHDGREHWEPTGRHEFRLDDGSRVEHRDDGTLWVLGREVQLRPAGAAIPS